MERRQAQALLEWYLMAGVDEAIDEAPHNRFAEGARPQTVAKAASPAPAIATSAAGQAAPARFQQAPERHSERPSARPNAPPGFRPASQPSAAGPSGSAQSGPQDGRALAAAASDLAALEAAVRGFEGCALKATAKTTCFADGNPRARVMFIGEGPGRDEDLQGKPFVGRAGQLLDRMLEAIGLDRSTAYITNVVYWRPPGNRNPTPAEMAACLPFTLRQIELADPALLVFLGGVSAKHLLSTSEGITRLRGRWRTFSIDGREWPAMATLHPAYLLRQPAQKGLAWADFLAIRARLDALEPPHS